MDDETMAKQLQTQLDSELQKTSTADEQLQMDLALAQSLMAEDEMKLSATSLSAPSTTGGNSEKQRQEELDQMLALSLQETYFQSDSQPLPKPVMPPSFAFGSRSHYDHEPRVAPTPECIKRLTADLKDVFRSKNPFIHVSPDEEDINHIQALIIGPPETPYAFGFFHFDMLFPHDYPHRPPKVKLITTDSGQVRFNPNLYSNGKVCLSILGTWQGPGWSQIQTIMSTLLSIQSLMGPKPYHNEPGFENEHRPGDSDKYNSCITHETLRVAVCGMVENPTCKPLFQEEIDEIFLEHFTEYEETCRQHMNLDGKPMEDPFGEARGKFRFGATLEKLQALKQTVLARRAAGPESSEAMQVDGKAPESSSSSSSSPAPMPASSAPSLLPGPSSSLSAAALSAPPAASSASSGASLTVAVPTATSMNDGASSSSSMPASSASALFAHSPSSASMDVDVESALAAGAVAAQVPSSDPATRTAEWVSATVEGLGPGSLPSSSAPNAPSSPPPAVVWSPAYVPPESDQPAEPPGPPPPDAAAASSSASSSSSSSSSGATAAPQPAAPVSSLPQSAAPAASGAGAVTLDLLKSFFDSGPLAAAVAASAPAAPAAPSAPGEWLAVPSLPQPQHGLQFELDLAFAKKLQEEEELAQAYQSGAAWAPKVAKYPGKGKGSPSSFVPVKPPSLSELRGDAGEEPDSGELVCLSCRSQPTEYVILPSCQQPHVYCMSCATKMVTDGLERGYLGRRSKNPKRPGSCIKCALCGVVSQLSAPDGLKALRRRKRRRQDQAPGKCAQHQDDFQLYCMDDQELLCPACAADHSSHNLEDLETAQSKVREQLQKQINVIVQKRGAAETFIKEVGAKKPEIAECTEKVKRGVVDKFAELRKLLEAKEAELLTDIDRVAETKRSSADREISQAQKRIDSIEQVTKAAVETTETTDCLKFLQASEEIEEQTRHASLLPELEVDPNWFKLPLLHLAHLEQYIQRLKYRGKFFPQGALPPGLENAMVDSGMFDEFAGEEEYGGEIPPFPDAY